MRKLSFGEGWIGFSNDQIKKFPIPAHPLTFSTIDNSRSLILLLSTHFEGIECNYNEHTNIHCERYYCYKQMYFV